MRNRPAEDDCQPLTHAARAREIAASFDQAAADYDRHAAIQERAAHSLAALITQRIAQPRAVLEIGCGTGLLTERLVTAYAAADWTITDLAPQMVARCRRRIEGLQTHNADTPSASGIPPTQGARDFRVMDAYALDVTGPFAVICSNLAFQWFSDLNQVVQSLLELLEPGGILAFNTLGAESFDYWRRLDRRVGGLPTAPIFLTQQQIAHQVRDACPPQGRPAWECHVTKETLYARHARFLDFLKTLNALGAGTRLGGRPLSRAELLRLLRCSESPQQEGGTEIVINYELVAVVIERPTT